MSQSTGDERAAYVQKMFARVALHYDLMNRIMTAGQDVSWRKEVIARARLPRLGILLDLGTGTGDLAQEAVRRSPGCRVVAADFTTEMMAAGRSQPGKSPLLWCSADALRLPFPGESFDAVLSGFLLRNVGDLPLALLEQARVLKPGGMLVVLDTTRPPRSLLSPFMQFYLHTVIPFLGGLIAGEPEAYRYLPESTENFLSAEQLAARMLRAGLQDVGFHILMFGAAAIHWGKKPIQ